MRSVAIIAVLAAVLGLWVASPAVAQEADEPSEKEQAAPAEKIVVTGEKVELRLRSGVPISGVVRAHRVEIQDGSRYLPGSDDKEKGAGIRVFYAMGLNGFIFVPYHTIDEISFKGELTAEEASRIVAALEAEREKAERDTERAIAELEAKKAEAARLAEEAEAEADEEGGAKKPDAPAAADPLASIRDPGRVVRIRKLLKQFPPESWTPERMDEIKRRAIILDVKPTQEERAFLESYDLWLEGYRLWENSTVASEPPKAEAPEAGENDEKSTKPDKSK